MRSVRIAEWILELSMTRERAGAVAGDLREAERGAFWYWRNVIATMIAGVWSDFLSVPWRLMATSVRVSVVMAFIDVGVLDFALRQSVEMHHRVNIALEIFIPLIASRWRAQCSGGREIASWLASQILGIVVILLMQLLSPNFHWSPWGWAQTLSLCLLGAMSSRVRPRLVRGLAVHA